jgi:hypothetical protein
MPTLRPRQAIVRMTEEQFRLCKRRMAIDDIGWQHLGQAAINAYILGHLDINRRGEVVWRERGDTDIFSEDPVDAVRQVAAALEGAPVKPKRKPAPVREWWDLHELARWLEEVTGRRVGHAILRMYLKTRHREFKPDARPGVRWKFYPRGGGFPGPNEMETLAEEVGRGDLDEFKRRRFESFGKNPDGTPLQKG